MSASIQAYVHKGCKTCKRATDYMDGQKISYSAIELFDARLDADEIRTLLRKLSISARDLLRPRDRMYRELDLRNRDVSDGDLIQLLADYPGLIKRPVLVQGDRAVFGIKPERVRDLIP